MNQLNTQNNPTQLFYYLICLRQSHVLLSRPWRGEKNSYPIHSYTHPLTHFFIYKFHHKKVRKNLQKTSTFLQKHTKKAQTFLKNSKKCEIFNSCTKHPNSMYSKDLHKILSRITPQPKRYDSRFTRYEKIQNEPNYNYDHRATSPERRATNCAKRTQFLKTYMPQGIKLMYLKVPKRTQFAVCMT